MGQAVSWFEIGWLVGILEGEGHFYFTATQVVQLRMCDEDVVARVAALYERITNAKCAYRMKERDNPKWNDFYELIITGVRARKVMKLIVAHMGHRRRQQIWQALNGYKKPKRLDTMPKGVVRLLQRKQIGA